MDITYLVPELTERLAADKSRVAASEYTIAAATTLFVYDIVLTLPDEVHLCPVIFVIANHVILFRSNWYGRGGYGPFLPCSTLPTVTSPSLVYCCYATVCTALLLISYTDVKKRCRHFDLALAIT
jgi:hypothetical protein